MLQLLSDRFVPSGPSWVDLATGDVVRVRLSPAGTLTAQHAFADRCAALGAVRHPLLNPLLDHGACDSRRMFEAYAIEPPARLAQRSASRWRRHALSFLESRGIVLDADTASLVYREVVRGPVLDGTRPIGIVLQRRRALDTLIELLDAQAPAGAVHVEVAGAPGSGLTTLERLVAREARIRGYIPVAARILRRWPALLDVLATSHVCLLLREPLSREDQRASAACLARLALASARRHLVVRLRREPGPQTSAILLDPLGAATMTGMVFIDPDAGPSTDELFNAARRSDGMPGTFLEQLGAGGYAMQGPRHVLIHEVAIPYSAEESRSGPSAVTLPERLKTPARRDCGIAERARTRAAAFAARGQHRAAAHLLRRAARVFEGRHASANAAECFNHLGWINRARGRSAPALDSFDRAAMLAGERALALEAVVGRGVVLTDEGRFVEAEAALRGVTVAARNTGDTVNLQRAALALARALVWQRRTDEASVLLTPILPTDSPVSAEAWALVARVRVLDRNPRAALEAARLALAGAARSAEARPIAKAHLAMAVVLHDLGETERVREHARLGLASARSAHLPLLALRLRAFMRSPRSLPPHAPAHRQMLPRLVDAQLRAAAGADVSDFVRETGARALQPEHAHRSPSAPLETLLEISHAAPDERAALEQICAQVCDRLRASTAIVVAAGPQRRVLAAAGRPSQAEVTACAGALASGCAVLPQHGVEPRVWAEPIRYGGHVVGALGCRWLAGTVGATTHIEQWLRPAALASAASVRILLDEVTPHPPVSNWNDLLGDSAAACTLREAVARAARAPFPVLITGESGSGKELVARAIHRLGPRRDRRWCAVNCAAISDDLLEAELFGHTRGAYTGAVGERAGLFEEADGGTLFLDEVGDLSARAQAKLLRVLQDGEVRRVGENLSRRVDVRVVAATNRRLEEDTATGRFRADLRFRLDVVRIVVPPLRDRIGDIPLLAAHFWRSASAQVGSCATLASETLAALARYEWPGNVRELQNVIAWMAVHSPRRGRVGPSSLPAHLAHATTPSSGTFEVAREEFERRFVRAALARAGGRRSVAAGDLGVSRQGLAKMLRRLNIEAP